MLKQRREATERVAGILHETEAAIDAAICKAAALQCAIPAARSHANLSALYAHEAVEKITETIAALTMARRGIVEAHKELTITKKQMGLGAVAYGDGGTKPPQIGETAPALRAVEAQAA